jgi:hypothetical protein
VAAGALTSDFESLGISMVGLTARFADGLEEVARLLRGGADGALAQDPALVRCIEHPIPLLSAAVSVRAVERAARVGVGILLHSLATPENCRRLADAYRAAGGRGPVVLIRRAWLGTAPREQFDAQLDVYRSYTPGHVQADWGDDELAARAEPVMVASEIVAATKAAGADSVNLRVHVPGVTPETAREQITRIGDEVLPHVRAALEPAGQPG